MKVTAVYLYVGTLVHVLSSSKYLQVMMNVENPVVFVTVI